MHQFSPDLANVTEDLIEASNAHFGHYAVLVCAPHCWVLIEHITHLNMWVTVGHAANLFVWFQIVYWQQRSSWKASGLWFPMPKSSHTSTDFFFSTRVAKGLCFGRPGLNAYFGRPAGAEVMPSRADPTKDILFSDWVGALVPTWRCLFCLSLLASCIIPRCERGHYVEVAPFVLKIVSDEDE